jgi:hypothetical protein
VLIVNIDIIARVITVVVLNTPLSVDVTDCGTVIALKVEQRLKAELPIVVMAFPEKVTDVSAAQL